MIDINAIKAIPITDYLASIGHPHKVTNGIAYACASIVRSGADNPRNFTVSLAKNLWKDQVSGKGGSIIDLVMQHRGCDYIAAIRWLQEFDGQRERKDKVSFSSRGQDSNTLGEVVVVTHHPIQHPLWRDFVRSRGLSLGLAMKYLSEVQFAFKSDLNRKFWGVGWMGRNGRWHLRTQMTYLKHVGQSPSEPTFFPGNGEAVCVFEGMFDFLSLVEMAPGDRLSQDVIVLNSVALVDKIIHDLAAYAEVHLYLDNDAAGTDCTRRILEVCPHAVDHRNRYAAHKDVNEFLMANRQPSL